MPFFAHHYHIVTHPLLVLLSPGPLDGREALRICDTEAELETDYKSNLRIHDNEYLVDENAPFLGGNYKIWMTMFKVQ